MLHVVPNIILPKLYKLNSLQVIDIHRIWWISLLVSTLHTNHGRIKYFKVAKEKKDGLLEYISSPNQFSVDFFYLISRTEILKPKHRRMAEIDISSSDMRSIFSDVVAAAFSYAVCRSVLLFLKKNYDKGLFDVVCCSVPFSFPAWFALLFSSLFHAKYIYICNSFFFFFVKMYVFLSNLFFSNW